MKRMPLLCGVIMCFLNSCLLPPRSYYWNSINASEGLIQFELGVDTAMIGRFADKANISSRDTCFIYHHVTIDSKGEVSYDTTSYSCKNGTILEEEKLSEFGNSFVASISTKEPMKLLYSPYSFLIQMTIEVGKDELNSNNRYMLGYSTNGNFDSWPPSD